MMKSILLIGLGRFGKHIAMHLNQLHHQIMAVDHSEERVDAALPFVTNAQIGDSTNLDFMESLGVRNFDVCIVAIGNNFQSSLETTSLLKELGAKLVVSRAARDVQAKFLLRNGADEIVYPEKQLAKWTAIRYSADHILDYMELDSEHAMFEIPVPGSWDGQTIGQIDIRKKFNINIMGIKKMGKLELSVSPDMMLQTGETMLVLGRNKDLQKCFRI
jgi:trk system potassium uptake protein TrkA